MLNANLRHLSFTVVKQKTQMTRIVVIGPQCVSRLLLCDFAVIYSLMMESKVAVGM
jgi:hypothetical protein